MRQKSVENTGRSGGGGAGSPEASARAEAQAAAVDEIDPAQAQGLMEACVETWNMREAWRRVRRNGGAAGADGLSVDETAEHLKRHWVRIREALLRGEYQPQPVRSAEIPKPGGGIRELGIPSATDRLIQQALLQVLTPIFEPAFHPSSFGFRPGRGAHDAMKQAKAYVQEGRKWVADADLEKFFDRVNHDILMGMLAKRIRDGRVLKLIRRYLKAGIMRQGVCEGREEGTPQGGPLSPLLANVILNAVDWQLERRGLAFCRYADDCNIYVRSRKSAQRALSTLRHLVGKLKLRLNESKSAADRVSRRKFLGFQVWYAGAGAKLRVADKALKTFKDRVRRLTSRSRGRSVENVVKELGVYLTGWKAYFRLADTPKRFTELDGWIRRRLRAIHLKQWKRGRTAYRKLVGLGLNPETARAVAANRRRYAFVSKTTGINVVYPNSYFNALGLPSLAG